MSIKREGLSQVFPEGEALVSSSSKDPIVNVVFVHGLRGHPRRTWEYKQTAANPPGEFKGANHFQSPWLRWALPSTNEVNKKSLQEITHDEDIRPGSNFWPADELPKIVPRANIFTYGYNADVIEGIFCPNNYNSILQHGNDLMVELERSLENELLIIVNCAKLPVIFVAHSLGGIIVKAAIHKCRVNLIPKYKNLLSRVQAIVFCGTPHRGSSAAAWGHLVSNIVTMALQSSNHRLLSDLKVDSQILDFIQDDFLRVLQGGEISVHSFQESRGLSGIKGFSGKVVDDSSSKLGYVLETTETIDANHMDMVLVGSRKISAVIKGYIRDIEKKKKDQMRLAPWANKAYFNHIVAPTLSAVYPFLDKFRQLDYQEFLFRVAKRHPNTCSWLIENPCFVQWRNTMSYTYFWLHGYPGQGKSVLARYTLERLREADCTQFNQRDKQERANALVCYFFCSDDDARAKSPTSLVASLIHQLLCEVPSLVEKLSNSPYAEITSEVSKSIWDLWKIFVLLLEGLGTRPLYIVIDALDELEKSEWEPFLTGMERTIRPEMKNIKVLFTSRTEPELEKILLSWDIMHLKLDDSTESQEDRVLFIQETVNEYALENCFEEGMKEIISESIIARAKGSFLWASLAWAHFKDGIGSWTKDLLRQRLNELRQLPPGMESLYHRLLYSVDKRLHAELLHVLQWIVAARCPLNIKQMSVALALAERPLCSREMNVKLSLKEFLRRACPHLIQVDDRENVTLVHHSFKTFLLQKNQSNLAQGGENHKFHVDLKQVDTQLGRDCMWYMGFEDSWSEEIRLERMPITKEGSADLEDEYIIHGNPWYLQNRNILVRHPFLSYASTFWSSHIHGSDDDSQFYQAFKRVLNRQLNYRSLCFLTRNNAVHEPPLLLATQYELSGLMKNLILDGHDINATNGGRHIIHYSSTPEHLQAVLRLGADINGRDEHGQTIFLRLIRKVSRELWIPRRYRSTRSRFGWDLEAEIEGRSWNRWESKDPENPEDFKGYHLNEVKKALCNPAVDINASDRRGWTPIHAVIIHNGPHANDLLNMLMTRQDLYLNPEDELGRTPLTLAIHWGRESMTRNLLGNAGVNIENARIQGENARIQGESPLINATRQGWTDLVLSLLNRLDEIGRFSDNNGRNVLHWAIIVGMMNAFELALKKDRNLLAVPDRQGMTPLHYSAQEGEYRATMILLSLGASPTDREVFGQTALHLAAAKGHIRILKALVAHLPTPSAINERDSMGWTALHRAVVSGNDVLVNYLSLENVDLTKVDRHGRAPVAFAASFSSLTTLNTLLKARARDFKAKLGQADIFCIDAHGNSLLHLAARASNNSTLDFLVTKIAHMGNRPNKWGRTARDLISPELCLPSFQLKLHTYGLRSSTSFSRLRPHCCLDEEIYGQPERPVHLDWMMIVYETPSSPAEEETDEETVEETVADFSHNGSQNSSSFSADQVSSEPLVSGSRLHQDTAIKREAMTDFFGKGNRSFVPPFPVDQIHFSPTLPRSQLYPNTAKQQEAIADFPGKGTRTFVPAFPIEEICFDPRPRPSRRENFSGEAKQTFINPFSADQFNPILTGHPELFRPSLGGDFI